MNDGPFKIFRDSLTCLSDLKAIGSLVFIGLYPACFLLLPGSILTLAVEPYSA